MANALEREWLRADLSNEIRCRVLVTGEISVNEIDVLIKCLRVQQRIRRRTKVGVIAASNLTAPSPPSPFHTLLVGPKV